MNPNAIDFDVLDFRHGITPDDDDDGSSVRLTPIVAIDFIGDQELRRASAADLQRQ